MDNRDNSTSRSIPEFNLNGQDSATHTVPSLKCGLLCRGASTKGRKADLVAQYVPRYYAAENYNA